MTKIKTPTMPEALTTLFRELGAETPVSVEHGLKVFSPIDGATIAVLKTDDDTSAAKKIKQAESAFLAWRTTPAPLRGELIRLFGEDLRKQKEVLAELVTLECGKILTEGRGEVQEMIDICDFAVGLSRQVYGLTIASERPQHVMQESWHPLGPVGVITAFNFPVAVWAWNFALALVCGNSVLWKPSEKTPLCALACAAIFEHTVKRCRDRGHQVPPFLNQILLGDHLIGDLLVRSPSIALLSATGSTRMGRAISPLVAARFGRTLLELGGNNAVIVSSKADLKLAHDAILFGAVGTAGQRCTTTRRALVHRSVFDKFVTTLTRSFKTLGQSKIGSPLSASTLIGPLIDRAAFDGMQKALRAATREGGEVLFGERVLQKEFPKAYYVTPALVRMPKQTKIVLEETFAPILYVMPFDTLDEAIRMNNAASQGLSSAIFTTDVREAEVFRRDSDCGISNINIGTSGAEIGGAFGGEKETGGGRESGTDSWKNYMRRQTSTLYYGTEKPALAQGIVFDVG